MTISDGLVIAAIIIAPILAVRIQKFIENKKGKRERRMQVFRTLMATRATPLYPQHVEALNMIDIEFFGNESITEAWKLLLDNFANYPQDTEAPNYQAQLNSCIDRSNDLLTDLLYEMTKALGYKFDKVHLKRGVYIPRGHAEQMMDQEFIRRAFVGVLSGQVPIPIKVVSEPSENMRPPESITETDIEPESENA